eukprot:3234806-Amphidinium_carterae.1
MPQSLALNHHPSPQQHSRSNCPEATHTLVNSSREVMSPGKPSYLYVSSQGRARMSATLLGTMSIPFT